MIKTTNRLTHKSLALMESEIPKFKELMNEGWSVHIAQKKLGWTTHKRNILEKERPDLFEFIQEKFFEKRKRGWS